MAKIKFNQLMNAVSTESGMENETRSNNIILTVKGNAKGSNTITVKFMPYAYMDGENVKLKAFIKQRVWKDLGVRSDVVGEGVQFNNLLSNEAFNYKKESGCDVKNPYFKALVGDESVFAFVYVIKDEAVPENNDTVKLLRVNRMIMPTLTDTFKQGNGAIGSAFDPKSNLYRLNVVTETHNGKPVTFIKSLGEWQNIGTNFNADDPDFIESVIEQCELPMDYFSSRGKIPTDDEQKELIDRMKAKFLVSSVPVQKAEFE